jgi:hypothetical protein
VKNLLLKTPRQHRGGEIVSALGFAAYLAGEALHQPDSRMVVVLAIFTAVSVWTLLSILAAPGGKEESGVTPSFLIGQSSVTLLLAACLVLTVRALLGA